MEFKDHFSGHAKSYVKHRPTYPNEMYELIYMHVNQFNLALDCGTGNGQVAVELAKKFKKVIATDASSNQISNAIAHPKVEYRVRPSENSELENNSVDLLTVGQALHWFNFDAFFKEVERVLKPDGVFACWTYKYLTINEELDTVLEKFFVLIDDYWPPERDYVMAEYKTIPFPKHFVPIDFPVMTIDRPMTADEALNYLRTWSSVKNYKHKHDGEDPLLKIQDEFYKTWNENINTKKVIKHPLVTKVFKLK